MTVTTIYYQQELMLPSTYKAGQAILNKPMREYFEDFLRQSIKEADYSSCYFYIDAKAKKLDRMAIWYECGSKLINIDPHYVTKDIKHVMCLATDNHENILVDQCIEKVASLFFTTLKNQDFYDIHVHARLTGLKLSSCSSDIYRIQIDNLAGKIRLGLAKEVTSGYKVDLPLAKIKASIISATFKK